MKFHSTTFADVQLLAHRGYLKRVCLINQFKVGQEGMLTTHGFTRAKWFLPGRAMLGEDIIGVDWRAVTGANTIIKSLF